MPAPSSAEDAAPSVSKTTRAVAGALLAFAPLASAEIYGVLYKHERAYASAALSAGAVQIDYRGVSPEIDFMIGMGKAEADGILEGDTVAVAFTLANAKFGRAVVVGDMRPEIGGVDAGTCGLRVTDIDGGERGSSAVTFEIEAADNACFCTAACAVHIHFAFSLPWLSAVTGPVSATVTTDAPDGSGWPVLTEETPGDALYTDQGCEAAATAATPCTKLHDGVLQRQTAPANGRRTPLAIIDFRPDPTF